MNTSTTSSMIHPANSNKVDKPWGYELRWAMTDKYTGKVLHINTGEELSLQYHHKKDEWIYVLDGKLELALEDDDGEMQSYILTPGMDAHVRPPKKHRFIALGDTNLIEVSTAILGDKEDVVRLEDKYGRAGT